MNLAFQPKSQSQKCLPRSCRSQHWSWFSLLTVLPTRTQTLVISHFPYSKFSPYFNFCTPATAQISKCKRPNTNFKFSSLFHLSLFSSYSVSFTHFWAFSQEFLHGFRCCTLKMESLSCKYPQSSPLLIVF